MWKFSYLLGKHEDFVGGRDLLWDHEKTVAGCDKRPIDVCSVRKWASRRVSNPILIKYAQAEIAHWTEEKERYPLSQRLILLVERGD